MILNRPDLDRDVDASMRMFEKSKVGPAAAVIPVQPKQALLVLDGSPQDETGIAAATYLHDRFRTVVFLLDGRDPSTREADEQEDDLALRTAPSMHEARPLDAIDASSYDAILQAIEDNEIELLILPCPFGRSFEDVGADSAGTVIDVLLARCPIPMLVNRRDDQGLSECIAKVSLVVGSECDVESKAARWVFGLAAENASVTLNLVIEKEQYENIRSIVEALSPDASFETRAISLGNDQDASISACIDGQNCI